MFMFMRTILALSFAAFALAVPVALPQDGKGNAVGTFYLSQYAPFSFLID
jgi:hypothetical protein